VILYENLSLTGFAKASSAASLDSDGAPVLTFGLVCSPAPDHAFLEGATLPCVLRTVRRAAGPDGPGWSVSDGLIQAGTRLQVTGKLCLDGNRIWMSLSSLRGAPQTEDGPGPDEPDEPDWDGEGLPQSIVLHDMTLLHGLVYIRCTQLEDDPAAPVRTYWCAWSLAGGSLVRVSRRDSWSALALEYDFPEPPPGLPGA
jgi:hypothetical protein